MTETRERTAATQTAVTGRTFGIEEEFILLDPGTLRPTDIAATAVDDLALHRLGGTVSREFMPSQVEHATVVLADADAALRDLRAFRRALGAWADVHGVVAAPSGTPPRRYRSRPEVAGVRYRLIADDVGLLTDEHLICGTHVHVGVPDEEDRVRALNALREWIPLLVALSGNSPYWDGRYTGHRSWRVIHARRWTTAGIPPFYRDFADHERIRLRLEGIGATRRYSEASWGVCLSDDYPTVEVRACDAQLTASSAVVLAELIRTVVSCALDVAVPALATPHHILDAELWHAARYGAAVGVHDPFTGVHAPVDAVLATVRERIRLPEDVYAALLRLACTSGADEQLRTRSVRGAICDLYRTELVA